DAHVEGDYVPALQAGGAGDAVHDHGVWGGADGGREVGGVWSAGVALELRGSAVGAYKVFSEAIELARGHAGLDVFRQHLQAGGGYAPALAHRLQFSCALADDQASSFWPT